MKRQNSISTMPSALLTAFTRVAEPMAIDPNWNRFWAIAQDECGFEGEEACDYWLKYIDDLDSIPAFTASERPLAQAMVWCRVAVEYRDQAEDCSSPRSRAMPFGFLEEPEEAVDVEHLRSETIRCLERSVGLAPDYLPAHRLLMDAHRYWKNTAEYEAAAMRLLARAPEDVETLKLMLQSAIERDDHQSAMAFVRKARALKPLDSSLRQQEWTVLVGLARKCAIAARWDEGRDHFRAADELLPDWCGRYYYLGRKVLFEAKAGQRDESDRFLRDAQATLPEPTPLWLSLAIESSRYRMTHGIQNGYAELWIADLKKKCRSETAGAMALLLDAYRAAKVDYPGRAGHIEHLVGYLERTSRVKYRQIDIEHVCAFLIDLPGPRNKKLLEKLLDRGLKLHPKSVLLNYHAANSALTSSKPPFLDPRASKRIETALKLAETSSDPAETELLPAIKKMRTMIEEVSNRLRRVVAGGGLFPFLWVMVIP